MSRAHHVVALARKELLQIRRDPISLFVLLGMPAALLLLFGYALTLDVTDVPLAVLDRDRSAASRELVGRFGRTEAFEVVARPSDEDAVRRLLDGGRVKAALVIPPDYGRRVAARQPAAVQLLVDGADSNTARIAKGYAEAIVAEAGAALTASAASAAPASPPAPFEVRSRVFFNPALESALFVVPGLLGIVVLVAATLMTAASVAREREQGTFETLLASPAGRLGLIAGKGLPFVGLAALDVAGALLAARLVFDVPIRGSLLALAVVSLTYVIVALGLGLLISTVATNQQAAFQIALLTTLLPSFLLSGFVFPIENMIPPVQAVAATVPAQYYLRALRAIVLKGAPLASVAPDLAALGGFALLFPLLAIARFPKRLA